MAGPTPLDGNYEDLFGDWLPSKWQPMGIFSSDASDLTTDNELLAFWGDALNWY